MKVSVNKSMLKRIHNLEHILLAPRIIALIPDIMGVDEWSKHAQLTQENLCQDTREDQFSHLQTKTIDQEFHV